MGRYIIVLLCLLPLFSFAQKGNKGKQIEVLGEIYSGNENAPLTNATLQLYLLPDTLYSGGTATDEEGRFAIKTASGN